MIRLNCTV